MESLNDVGSITYFNADGSIHETVTFNNQERYLEEAKEALKTRGITGWKCNTLSKDLNLHYELYKMIADEVDDDAMSRGEYARQHPELQKTEEIERTTQAAIRTDSKYQQAEQRRPKVSNLTNAIKEKISITEYAAMLGYHVKQISSDRYTLLEHDSMAIKFDKSGMEYFIWNSRGIGGIVGHETNRWVADTSDHNLLLIAPPGAGKTTGVFIPTIYYNARVNINTKGRGASMLIVDCKGTLYNECSAFLRKAGYRTPILNIRDVTRSSHFNLMHEVNCAMDEYMAATDKLDRAVKYGRAERYAKAVASQLVDNGTATVKSEASDYFVETSRGLITGIILLVSQYGQSEERHIISVFKVILEMNGQLESLGEDDGPQANKLEHLLTFCGNERIRYYTGAATSADLKTSMNIFSSALGKLTKFIDAELEQLLCSHDAELDADRFIENPTAVFLISPDENTSRHFINSLYIRNLMNDLIYLAESKYGGRCPRDWLLLIDEFGQQPAIEGVDAATAAIRSRGGRAMLSLQNLTQLEKQYNRTLADIIKGTGQTVMFSFVSPTALSSAKVFSEAMGKETVMTGSTTSAKGNTSVTRSMVGRPLMDAADIIALEREVFIVLKGGCRPFRSRAEGYYKYLDLGEHKAEELPALDFQEIITFDPEAFMRRNVKMPSCRLTRGMFD
ncbi:type IV secretory system conjugative DNA transfer family protein [Ruthenibacterium lactatiformans]|uniref:type IV secretory system conjugative DNA transfer family protein n=1 Tax=Ruthenibacterium lactatiformans TaxID=1550024 RepID=UPI0039F5609D